MLHGLGRALPKGKALFVPYNCDVVIVGDQLKITDTADEFVDQLGLELDRLSKYCTTLAQDSHDL